MPITFPVAPDAGEQHTAENGVTYEWTGVAWRVVATPSSGAPIDSPHFTGNPTAPTPTPGDDDQSIATTGFVNDAIADAIADLPPPPPPDLSGYLPLSGGSGHPMTGTLYVPAVDGTPGDFFIMSAPGYGIYLAGDGGGGSNYLQWGGTVLTIGSTFRIQKTGIEGTVIFAGAIHPGIRADFRTSGTLALRTEDDEADATLVAGVVRTIPVTVATLPDAASAGAGARAFVSDANASTFNTIVAAGGSNAVPVFSDGASWRIG
jgi:hypothetical protein